MKRSIVLLFLSIAALLVGCSQAPAVPKLNPEGTWSGTWRQSGATPDPLTVTFTRTATGWQGVFNNIVAACGNLPDEGPLYLWCTAYTSVEVLTWEGNVAGDSWSGVWSYIGPSMNAGRTFELNRN